MTSQYAAAERRFARIDQNHDGVVTAEEAKAGQHRGHGGKRGKPGQPGPTNPRSERCSRDFVSRGHSGSHVRRR